MVARGWGEGGMGATTYVYSFIWSDYGIFEVDRGSGCTTVLMY